jgi:hypothetical protein
MAPKDLVWCLLLMSEIEMTIVEGACRVKGILIKNKILNGNL